MNTKNAQDVYESLRSELSGMVMGDTTFIPVAEPTATQPNASGFDVVVLESDGRTVAFHYADDAFYDPWVVGNLEQLAQAVATMACTVAACKEYMAKQYQIAA